MSRTVYLSKQRRDSATQKIRPPRLRKPWPLPVIALLVVAVFAGAALGYSLLLQPKVYGAQAEFIITPRPDISDAAVDRAMLTQVMIIESAPVLQPVAAQAGMGLSRLRDAVSVEIVGRSNILRVTVSDRSRGRAVSLVQLISNQYLRTPASTTAAPAGAGAGEQDLTPPTRSTLLTPASPLEEPIQPRPLRALAAGTLLGLIAAGVTAAALLRPRFLNRPWK